MEYNQLNLVCCSTGGIITKFKQEKYEDGKVERTLLTFDNGLVLEVGDEYSIKFIKELIRKKKYVSIHFELNIFKEKKH